MGCLDQMQVRVGIPGYIPQWVHLDGMTGGGPGAYYTRATLGGVGASVGQKPEEHWVIPIGWQEYLAPAPFLVICSRQDCFIPS